MPRASLFRDPIVLSMTLRPRAVATVLAGVFVLLALRLGHFVDRFAVNLVFWDQWDFLQGLFDGSGAWTLFRWQHGPHRQGLAQWIIAGVYRASDWNGRADAACAAVVMLLAGVLALLLVRRAGGPLRVVDAVVPLLFLTTQNAETYAGTPNLAHGALPCLILVSVGCALTLESPVPRAVLLAVLSVLGVSGGFGMALGGIIPAMLGVFALGPGLTVRERVVQLLAAVVSGAGVLLFLHGYTLQPAVECFAFPHPRPLEYLPFGAFVLARPFGVLPGHGAAAGVLAGALGLGVLGAAVGATVQVLRSRGGTARTRAVSALAGFAILFAAQSAVGRVCTGLEFAAASRYVPYVVPGLLALYLMLRDTRLSPPVARALPLCFLVLCVAKELRMGPSLDEARAYSSGKRHWRDCYLREHDIARCDRETGFSVYPDPSWTHLQAKLDWLEARGLSFFHGRARPQVAAPER
ncbi:hypothetical protein JGU66_26350 [Myxococcaceae bacterium JPH2]|nr:hypothetical protein [Myxococcaceae bacterium JPH2]